MDIYNTKIEAEMGPISPKHLVSFDFSDCQARNAPNMDVATSSSSLPHTTQTPSPRPPPLLFPIPQHLYNHPRHQTARPRHHTAAPGVPETTTQSQDTTTRRGSPVGTRTWAHDNDEGGDGSSYPSPQKVRFFLVITLYISTDTPPPLRSHFHTPHATSHLSDRKTRRWGTFFVSDASPPLPYQPKLEGMFYVFGWFSSTQPFPPAPTTPRRNNTTSGNDDTKGRLGGDENTNARQRRGWGWAVMPILTKCSFCYYYYIVHTC